MNRSALAYIVTLNGADIVPFVGKCFIDQSPDGYRVAVNDGSGSRWYPQEGLASIAEDDDSMILMYEQQNGRFGEVGLKLEPATVDRWNALAKKRPEMKYAFNFDHLVSMLRGF